MAEPTKPRQNFDTNWKLAIERMFKAFILFFMKYLADKIDFGQKIVFIENEFQNEIEVTAKGRVYTDKLAKVQLKDGTSKFILIHIEIQSFPKGNFSWRMLDYFYNILRKYREADIASIAVFTFEEVPDHYLSYQKHFTKTKLTLEYDAYKVEDVTEQELLESDNPFALVILAIKYLKKTQNNHQLRLDLKKTLIQLTGERGYSENEVFSLLTFIEHVLILNDEVQQENEAEIFTLYKNTMDMSLKPLESKVTRRIYDKLHQELFGYSPEQKLREAEEATRQKEEATRQKEEATRQKEEAEARAAEATRQKEEAVAKATRQKEEATRQKEEAVKATRQKEEAEAKLLKSAKKLLELGLSPQSVAETLDLPLEKIQRL